MRRSRDPDRAPARVGMAFQKRLDLGQSRHLSPPPFSRSVRIRKFIVALLCLALPLQAVAVSGLAPRIAADVAAAAHSPTGHADHAAHPGDADRTTGEAPRDCDVCGDCTPCLSGGGLAAPTGAAHLPVADRAAHAHGAHLAAVSFTPEVPKRPPLAHFL